MSRLKADILEELETGKVEAPGRHEWQSRESRFMRLQLEVFVDIRDALWAIDQKLNITKIRITGR